MSPPFIHTLRATLPLLTETVRGRHFLVYEHANGSVHETLFKPRGRGGRQNFPRQQERAGSYFPPARWLFGSSTKEKPELWRAIGTGCYDLTFLRLRPPDITQNGMASCINISNSQTKGDARWLCSLLGRRAGRNEEVAIEVAGPGLKHGRKDEDGQPVRQNRKQGQDYQDIMDTNKRFSQAMEAPKRAPTILHELELMLKDAGNGFIPVSECFYKEIRSQGLTEGDVLVVGYGPVAEYMSSALRILGSSKVGATEMLTSTTSTNITALLFSIMYAFCLDKFLPADKALNATYLSNASVSKATSSTVQVRKRPVMVVMSKRKLSLFIVEDKKQGHGPDAAQDLKDYLGDGLPPGYQQIPCIPVATVAGCDIKFGLCDVHGKVSLMTNAITINSPGGAIQAVAASLQVYRIMMKLNDLAPLELMDMGLGGTMDRENGCTLEFGSRKSGIIKTVRNFNLYSERFGVDFEEIKEAYTVKSPFLPKINAPT